MTEKKCKQHAIIITNILPLHLTYQHAKNSYFQSHFLAENETENAFYASIFNPTFQSYNRKQSCNIDENTVLRTVCNDISVVRTDTLMKVRKQLQWLCYGSA